jgi:hypothetical protein
MTQNSNNANPDGPKPAENAALRNWLKKLTAKYGKTTNRLR